MERHEQQGVVFYRFASLAADLPVEHAIFTRLGGVSEPPYAELNLGHTVGDNPRAVENNHERVLGVLGTSENEVVTAWQVHGRTIHVVDGSSGGCAVSRTDGLLTRTPGLVLLQRFADCLPLLFIDPVQGVAGLVHAGWRGTLVGIANAAVTAMARNYGSRVEDVAVGIGPGIGPCCYEVGDDVITRVRRSFVDPESLLPRVDGSLHFDLPAANARQLQQLGVRRIGMSGLCTACRTDEFFSHRAEKGRTGRFGVAVWLPTTKQ